ncbi:DedA family protein, partial [Neisseria meningitidis]|nr:DedA family protein [Neisseria meningitidis]
IFVILGIGATVVAWIWWKKRQRIQFYRSKLKEKRAQRKAAKAAKKAAQSKQ